MDLLRHRKRVFALSLDKQREQMPVWRLLNGTIIIKFIAHNEKLIIIKLFYEYFCKIFRKMKTKNDWYVVYGSYIVSMYFIFFRSNCIPLYSYVNQFIENVMNPNQNNQYSTSHIRGI